MSDLLDQVFEEQPQADEPAPNPDPAPEPAPVEAPQPEPAPEVVEPQPVVEPRTEDRIPIGALLDEREKRKELERELATLRQQQPQQQANIPDPYDDPQGYSAYIENRIGQERQVLKNQFSHQFAVRDYGQDKVEEARVWALEKAQKDPVFGQQVEAAFQTQASPFEWVVQQHKRDSLLSDIGDNVDDWFTREAVKRGYAAMNASPAAAPVAVAPAPALRQPAPPRSIAADATPVNARDPGEPASFSAIFQR